MIVAGDFAQLPPPKGQALYSGEVSQVQLPRQTEKEQENTMGLLLWHQFTTVVILRQNMRQVGNSAANVTMRRVLERMRYKDCTIEDLIFLQSLIPVFNPEIRLSDDKWRDVSVITALNTHKDQINHMNATRFANERGRHLHYFYSVDKQSNEESGHQKKKKTATTDRPIKWTTEVQETLWQCQPYTSNHIAGCLAICIDMPIMIRYNVATELSITKGQEALVKGWTSREIPGYPGRNALETLFVELINPSKNVKIPYLPTNIVPLTKMLFSVKAVLPNDRSVSISRKQVPILLNFAMTDYCSQGKTQDVNIVDMKHCRSHQAMYVCLSRGKMVDDTLILREFDAYKLIGGLSGFLRQEFRTLDLLDEISRLRYEEKIPADIVQHLRGSTVAGYRAYMSGSLTEGARSNTHRPRQDTSSDMANAAVCPDTQLTNGFVSWRWDSLDWSCAFDSYLTILLFIWKNYRSAWLSGLSSYSENLRYLGVAFQSLENGTE
jgi:hypothetical protein